MSSLQELTLNRFIKSVGKKTLIEYSEITGIEKTRFFRLLNGSEMKLKEFELLQRFVRENGVPHQDWKQLLSEVELTKEVENDQRKKEATILLARNERLKAYLTTDKMAA